MKKILSLLLTICLLSAFLSVASFADNASAELTYDIGEKYYNEKDYEKALEYFQKAAEAGNAKAMNNIGNLYYDGLGVEQDEAKAEEWYAKAKAAGYKG